MLRTRLTLRPGQAGTRKLVDQFGAKLLCVRYRYDEDTKRRYKTVELVVEESEWIPRPRARAVTDLVDISLQSCERTAQDAIKLLGGVWHPATGTWRLAYGAAVALRLTDRIVEPPDKKTA